MSRKNKLSPFTKQCFVTAAVGINIIGHGCALGFPAILLPQLREPRSGFRLTQEEESWIASMTALCLLVGNMIASPIMDRFGRKGTHYILTVPFIVGWFMTVLASNVKIIMFARAILGICGGLLINLRSVLIGEYTSPKNRGAFLTIVSLAQAFGIFLSHLLGSFFNWQVTALICSFFPFISLVMTIYMPESPSWLAEQGRYLECSEMFRWLRGEDEEDELAQLIEARVELGKIKNKKSQANSNCLRKGLETIVKKEFYKPIILMIHANALMHFSGGTTMSTYAIVILSLIMGPTANVYFWMVFLDTQRILTNTLAIYVIKRIKRRTMLFSNGALSVFVHLAISVYVYGKHQGWTSLGIVDMWLPVLLVNMHFFAVGMAMVPMPNIIAGEVFPLQYRGIGGTISMSLSGVVSFSVLKTLPSLIDTMGIEGTYFIYSIIITYILTVVWVLLPETKGRTLQEIEDEFRGKPLKSYEIGTQQTLQSSLAIHELNKKVNKIDAV